MMKLDKF